MAMDHIAGKMLFLKLVHPGGIVERHHQPITAGEVMKKYPRHYVTRPDVFKYPWLVVRPESILQPGNKFYVVPEHTLRCLLQSKGSQNQKQPNGDGKLKERCRIKPYDRGSLRHRDSKVVDDPDEIFQKQPYPSESSAEMPHRTAKLKGVHPISRQSETKTSIKRFPIQNIDGKPYNKSGIAKKREGESDRHQKPCQVLPILDQLSDSSASNSDYPLEYSRDETKFSCIVKRRSQACRNRESCKLREAENFPPAYALGYHSEEVLSSEQQCCQSTPGKPYNKSGVGKKREGKSDWPEKPCLLLPILDQLSDSSASNSDYPLESSRGEAKSSCIVKRRSQACRNRESCKLCEGEKFSPVYALGYHSKEVLSSEQQRGQSTHEKSSLNSTSLMRTETENDGLDRQHPCNTRLPSFTSYTAGYSKIAYKANHKNFVEPKNSPVDQTKALSSKKQYFGLPICIKPTLDPPYQVQHIDGKRLQFDGSRKNLNHTKDVRGDAKSRDHYRENDHEMMHTKENVVQLKSCLRKDKSRSRGLRVRFTLPSGDEDRLRVEVFEYEDPGSSQSFDNCSLAPEFFDMSSHLCTPGNVLQH